MKDTNTSTPLKRDSDNVWHHMKPDHALPMTIERGEGMYVWDINGKQYLDAVSGGVWSVNVGYGREEIANAVRDQLIKMNYFAQSFSNIPATQFATKLLEKMPGMSRVYYSNSGSEANEKAFKLVRQIAAKKFGGKKYKILYRERDYHGTTISCLSATGQEERRQQYGPFTPGFIEVPHCCQYRSQWGDIEDYGLKAANEVERIILQEGPETVGAICLEPITAGGGVIEAPSGYWQRIQEICRQYDVLLHIDEVVCGLGRTGAWFGYQHYGIEPDIVTMAKGLASGYAAISCTVTTERVYQMIHDKDTNQRMDYFRDISTFGGCTAGPTAALVNLEIIEREHLVENAQIQGDYLKSQMIKLKGKHPLIGDVRGKGLFVGIELVQNKQSKQPVDESIAAAVVAHCMGSGVIIGRTNRSFSSFNNTLCLSPALITQKYEIDIMVQSIDKALSEIEKDLMLLPPESMACN
ncbi:aminotransferase family protein [Vibrio sagamiensis]|uniref:Aspartate aminotransferase family protein n=1 Tax=Vibrio sagamiensis NBRC 104589 TaxID=1219064 RepID=A0A511QB00_9VIBR|nr:aminotransferase class III-fold pyridoxal phosphate-dependent enzyme [Vibrio sagamiensis]PNQ55051.1 aspartate aminotransferase family protein [Vibrio agarivorans]GEM74416.1 aspartate aminotransferase family protein [Vibrio sagamiensis NBRC 104589]